LPAMGFPWARTEHQIPVATSTHHAADLAQRVNDIQVVVREMIYPGEEITPRPELGDADVETLTKVRRLLVDASTKLEPDHIEADRAAVVSLLREASGLLERASALPDEAAAERDAALRGIREIVTEQTPVTGPER
jgi:hypothetical protein